MIDFFGNALMYFLILWGAGWAPLINKIYKPSGFFDVLKVIPFLYAGILTLVIFGVLFLLLNTWIWGIIVVSYIAWTALVIAFGRL